MTALDLELVTVVGGPVRGVAEADVEALERELAADMPAGYRDYVRTLGAGTLETFVRVLTPTQITSGLLEHRGLLAGYWHWASRPGEFDQDALVHSIPVADTVGGDVVAFLPEGSNRLIVLPRNSDALVVREEGLLETIEWILTSGVLVEPRSQRQFEPLAEPEASGAPAAAADGGPAPAGSATDVVRAYLTDLLEVERWAIGAVGSPPRHDADFEALEARSDAVHQRYLGAALAHANRGTSVAVSRPPEHDHFEITDERPGRAGKAIVETREGKDIIFRRRYALTPEGHGFRITQITELGMDVAPQPPSGLGARLRSFFGQERD